MDVDTAQGLELGIAQELTGLTLQLTASLTVTVAGQVVDERGQPARNVPNVSLVRDGATDHLSRNFSEPVGADGVKPISSWNSPRLLMAYAAFFFDVVVSIFSSRFIASRSLGRCR